VKLDSDEAEAWQEFRIGMWECLEKWGRGEFAIGMIMQQEEKNMKALNSVFPASRGSFPDCSFPLPTQ